MENLASEHHQLTNFGPTSSEMPDGFEHLIEHNKTPAQSHRHQTSHPYQDQHMPSATATSVYDRPYEASPSPFTGAQSSYNSPSAAGSYSMDYNNHINQYPSPHEVGLTDGTSSHFYQSPGPPSYFGGRPMTRSQAAFSSMEGTPSILGVHSTRSNAGGSVYGRITKRRGSSLGATAAAKKAKTAGQMLTFEELQAPLSEVTKDIHQVSDIDIMAYVSRDVEKRRQERDNSKKGMPKRPPNAFMLYRMHYQKRCAFWSKDSNHQSISRICGKSWKMETDAVRDWYKSLADLEAKNHLGANPGYVYHPRKKRDPRRPAKAPEFHDAEPAYDPFIRGDPAAMYRAASRGVKSEADDEPELEEYDPFKPSYTTTSSTMHGAGGGGTGYGPQMELPYIQHQGSSSATYPSPSPAPEQVEYPSNFGAQEYFQYSRAMPQHYGDRDRSIQYYSSHEARPVPSSSQQAGGEYQAFIPNVYMNHHQHDQPQQRSASPPVNMSFSSAAHMLLPLPQLEQHRQQHRQQHLFNNPNSMLLNGHTDPFNSSIFHGLPSVSSDETQQQQHQPPPPIDPQLMPSEPNPRVSSDALPILHHNLESQNREGESSTNASSGGGHVDYGLFTNNNDDDGDQHVVNSAPVNWGSPELTRGSHPHASSSGNTDGPVFQKQESPDEPMTVMQLTLPPLPQEPPEQQEHHHQRGQRDLDPMDIKPDAGLNIAMSCFEEAL